MTQRLTRRSNIVKQTRSDYVLDAFVWIFIIVFNCIMLYPFLYVVSTAISDPGEVVRGSVVLLPKGFDMGAFRQMIRHPQFGVAYLNTVYYAIVGTLLTLIVTPLTAYPLTKANFKSRGFISVLYIITMFFSGGMIPSFLIIKTLRMVDTRWAIVLPGAISAWNVIIMRSFFKSIPDSLPESAALDGANEFTTLWRIIIPLSKPVLSTIGLFTMVGLWNDYFSALLYLNRAELFPIQMILRLILITATFSRDADMQRSTDMLQSISTQSLKSAAIIITILPIIMVYPFIQRFFVKGVMIGSIKG